MSLSSRILIAFALAVLAVSATAFGPTEWKLVFLAAVVAALAAIGAAVDLLIWQAWVALR